MVERLDQRGPHFPCQMGVDLGGASAVVTEVFLNHSDG